MAAPSTATEFKANFPSDSKEQILYLLRSATRAPSTHNSQPWKFKILEDGVEIHDDPSIILPLSDTQTRYAHISLGYLLHHIILLGVYAGMAPALDLGEGDVKAVIKFSNHAGQFDETCADMVNALYLRRNRRGLFEKNVTLPENLAAQISQPSSFTPSSLPVPEVSVVQGRDSIKGFGELTAQNMLRLYKNPAFRSEMASWIKPTGSGKKYGIPGYSLNQPVVMSWILPTMIRLINMGKVLAKLNYGALASASAVVAFGSEDEPHAWLGIGFQASHATLTLVSASYDCSVFVASVEMPDTRTKAQELAHLTTPLQFLFATGKLTGNADWYTPRVPVELKLIP